MNSTNPNNIIFLDIDGVLYPCRNRKSFSAKINKEYENLDPYTILCVQEGWNKEAITHLRILLEKYDSNIVISSSWKFKYSFAQLKTIFSIHDLDSYIIDCIPNSFGILKKDSIKKYLKVHPEIRNYIILDDTNMKNTYGSHFILCKDVLNKEAFLNAEKFLKKFKNKC